MSEYEDHETRMDALNDIGNKCDGAVKTGHSPTRRNASLNSKFADTNRLWRCGEKKLNLYK